MAVLRRALRSLSTFATVSNRCIVYAQNGDPTKVVKSLTFPTLPPPSPDTVNLRFLLSPINPADVNTIEGVYPEKPSLISNLSLNGLGSSEEPVYVGGTEGLAQVTQVGNGVQGLKEGDWVVMDKPQSGTWSTSRNVLSKDVLRLPASGLTEAHGATMTINPPTAYNMLNDFVDLKAGDWIIQNGANSAVGQLVIQLAKERGINTINFVRSRDDMTPLVKHLENLGATKVLTYEELSDKSLRGRVKEWTGGKDICLALNCTHTWFLTAQCPNNHFHSQHHSTYSKT
ncbi:hypothetical protein D9757_004770 [Collybiopsis confluens]|uniref:enoyl-[acyl-carrier-protein] reductase n=1 Tax=Collybiopsis confluens TaxID=2823264 RepID=A0A8H5HSG7_9AGAR|nr:hypothetical protein D9757_004770 [Collybiopsis confluens]